MVQKIRRKPTGVLEGNSLGVALRIALLILMVLSPLFLGVTMGNYRVLFGFRVLLVAVFVLAAIAGKRQQLRRVSPGFLFWILIGAAALGLVQMLPLPQSLAALLAPVTTELLDTVWPGVVSDDAMTYRIAPDLPWAASWVAWWLSAAGIFWLGRLLFTGHRRTMTLVRTFSFSAVLVVVVGLLHLLAGADKLWGIATWPHLSDMYAFSSVLRNNNQLGAYLAAGSLGFAGLAMYTRSQPKRSRMHVYGALLLGFFAVIANSRGVIVVLAAMLPLLWWIDSRQAKGPGQKGSAGLWWFAVPLVVIIAGFWYAAPLLVPDFAGAVDARGVGKFDLWIPAIPHLLRHGLLGIGLGAYPFMFFQFADTRPLGFAQTPECMPFDWALSLGLPLGIAISGGILYLVLHTLWKREKLHRSVAALILLFIFIHNLVDYNITLGAVQLPFFLLLGALSVTSSRTSSHSAHRRIKPVWVFTALAVLLLMSSSYAVRYSQSADWHRMHRLSAMDMPEQDFERLAQPMLLRHGLDGYLYELMASRYLKPRDQEALRQRAMLLNRALILRPNHPETHRRLALTYLRMRRGDQAFFHFARAFEYAYRLPEPHNREFRSRLIDNELKQLHFSPQQLWSMLPHERKWTEKLLRSAVHDPRFRSEAGDLIAKALKAHGDQAFIFLQAAVLARLNKDTDGQREYLDRAMQAAAESGNAHDRAQAAYGLALYHYHRGDLEQARPLFETAVDNIKNDAGPWTMYIRMLVEEQRYDAAREMARRGFGSFPNRFWYSRMQGDIDAARGETVKALQHYERGLMAARGETEKAALYLHAANIAIKADLLYDAQSWTDRLRSLDPQHNALPALQKRIDRRKATPLPLPGPSQ